MLRPSASDQLAKLIGTILERALKCSATEVHLERLEEGLRISYLIAGVLRDIDTFPGALSSLVMGSIKQSAHFTRDEMPRSLTKYEKELPQLSNLEVQLQGRLHRLTISLEALPMGERVIIQTTT